MFAVIGAVLLMTSGPSAAAPRVADDITRRAEIVSYFATDSVRLAQAMRRAEAFAAVGRMADARREYRSAIAREIADGGYPVAAMWALANAYYAADNLGAAARTLDAMGDAARDAIDPATELKARVEAVTLWAQVGRRDRAVTTLERVRALLRSPAVPAQFRDEVRRRLGEP